MNGLLYNSIKLAYTNSNTNLDELLYQYNITKDELIDYSLDIGDDIDMWENTESLPQPTESSPTQHIENPLQTTENLPQTTENEKDQLREDLNTAYENIVNEAKDMLATSFDLTPKDLKDIASTLKLIDDTKYPQKNRQALEVDMANGIVRFLAENTVDDL